MPYFVVLVALFNLALGFVMAVYWGAAPRFAHPRMPLLRDGHRTPPSMIARILAFLPRRKPKALP